MYFFVRSCVSALDVQGVDTAPHTPLATSTISLTVQVPAPVPHVSQVPSGPCTVVTPIQAVKRTMEQVDLIHVLSHFQAA